MVYSSHFVMCVLVNGQVQKELADGTVILPFNTTYSLRFRNKNNRRAVVKFAIDGENVSGGGYVIPASSFIDIHRHSNKDATFVFVDLDSPQAVDAGKNGPNLTGEKGLIEASFSLEKMQEWAGWPTTWPNPYVPPASPWVMPSTIKCTFTTPPEIIPSKIQCTFDSTAQSFTYGGIQYSSCNQMQDGCTVEGAASGQAFMPIYLQTEPESVRLQIRLKGGMPMQEAVLAYCTRCGAKKLRQNDNFCGVCGQKF